MDIRRRILTTLTFIAAITSLTSVASADGTLIRWHKMGEEEGGTNNSPVANTLDSPVGVINGIPDIQALDLVAANTPTYRNIVGRPDGGGGIGIEFAAAQLENLSGLALNWPQESALSDSQGGLYDLEGIADRSFQFWVRPTSAAVQSLVMDTNQHGVRINSSGNFSMRYGNVDYASTQAVVPSTWYHIQVVRPAGPENRSRMYVNGVAVAVSTSVDYAADNLTNLTVGSNTAGNGEFFSGVIDDLRMSVYGITTSAGAFNYGTYNFATENAFAADPDTGITGVPGDVNNSGSLTQADKDAFIAGWMDRRVVNGLQLGDLQSFEQGDLNLDGITNIFDLVLMQDALSGAGMGAITAADLAGVPEPSTGLLFLLAAFAVPRRFRRHS